MTHELDPAPHVLVVEDSLEDSILVIEGFKELGRRATFAVIEEGDDALAYLRQQGRHAEAKRPDLILLDLNLPRRSGHEVLEQVKNDEQLKEIPVVVLSTSSGRRDVTRSYQLHANCHIAKPLDLDGFMDVIREIDRFWLTIVELPPQPPHASAR